MKIIVLLFSFLLIGHSNIKNIQNKDFQYSQMIVGLWSFTLNTKDFTFYGETLYDSNGTKEGWAEFCENKKCKKIHFKSNWSIRNGFLISIPYYSNESTLPIGVKIIDRILKLDQKQMILRDIENGETTIDYRQIKSRFFDF